MLDFELLYEGGDPITIGATVEEYPFGGSEAVPYVILSGDKRVIPWIRTSIFGLPKNSMKVDYVRSYAAGRRSSFIVWPS
jgi:hypothetical protein